MVAAQRDLNDFSGNNNNDALTGINYASQYGNNLPMPCFAFVHRHDPCDYLYYSCLSISPERMRRNIARNLKLQSAMEYLMTYSWAILILAVVLGALFTLGLFNPSTFMNNQCLLPRASSARAFTWSNGQISIGLLQATTQPINITAIGYNAVARL